MKSPQDNSLCVIGLGYVGLPTALTFSQAGYQVRGYDKNARLVEHLNAGHADINEAGIEDLLESSLKSGKFKAYNEIQVARAYFICVPTPVSGVSKAPDLTAVFSAVEAIKRVIKPGDLVVLESTSPVGTTRQIYQQLSDHLKSAYPGNSNRIFAAYCPERILPGKVLEELSSLDRVIGGIDSASSAMAKAFFSHLTKGHCYETDAETAEFVKLAENSFRDVNIAFANELKNLCQRHGVNVENVRTFANMHPRVDILQPGIGVGGHCIPVDPWFLVHASQKDDASVIHAARRVNDRQPRLIANQIVEEAQKNKCTKLAIFGLTYKANVNDFRESPALDIVKHLSEMGVFSIEVYDPFLKPGTNRKTLFGATAKDLADISQEAQLYIFLVAHDALRKPFLHLSEKSCRILDFCHLSAGVASGSDTRSKAKVFALAKAH